MKKKKSILFISMIMTIAFIGSFFIPKGIYVNAKTNTNTTIEYSTNGEVKVGEVFDINVHISNFTNLYGASMDFAYDPSLIEIISVNKGDIFSNNVLMPINRIENGLVSIALTEKGNAQGITDRHGKLFVIKVRALKDGEIELKTTDSNSALSLKDNNVRIKIADSTAKKITYEANNYKIKFNSNGHAILQEGSYEETNSALKYIGNWNNHSDSKHSGGTMKYSANKGNAVEFVFEGTGFELYSMTSTARGKANIYIDGKLEQTINQYDSKANYNKAVYTKTGLTEGKHTVKIEVTGEKVASATGANVSIDRVVIKDKKSEIKVLQPGSYEETDAGLIYTGNWNNHSDSRHSGGTMKYSANRGNAVEFTFNGTGFELYSMTSTARGKANIYIDGKLVQTIDQYTSNANYNKAVYTKTGLTEGEHKVRIAVTGEKIESATGANVSIDRVIIK